MVTDDIDDIPPSELEFETRYGDDTPPLMASVPEPLPSHWGKTTSQARTTSPQYMAFLNRHRESMKNG